MLMLSTKNKVVVRIQIREQSFIAKIASIVLKQQKVAVVTGNIIHLYNTKKEEFLANKRWLQHELVHVLQYREHGHFKFITLYLWESIKKGYYQNRFEKEARLYEDESALSANVQVI